jgi:hypothetical protein
MPGHVSVVECPTGFTDRRVSRHHRVPHSVNISTRELKRSFLAGRNKVRRHLAHFPRPPPLIGRPFAVISDSITLSNRKLTGCRLLQDLISDIFKMDLESKALSFGVNPVIAVP